MQELLDNGFEIILTSVAAEGLDKGWLGRKIDQKMIDDLKKLHKKVGINEAFEGGEAETVVLDCPLFKKKILLIKTGKSMSSENSGQLIIKKAILINK